MISVTHFRSDGADFAERARLALDALAARPGYLRGSLGRSTDDPADWILVTEWENVGSYRRGLGGFDVKLRATPLLAESLDLPSSFEPLVEVAPGGVAVVRESDRNRDPRSNVFARLDGGSAGSGQDGAYGVDHGADRGTDVSDGGEAAD